MLTQWVPRDMTKVPLGEPLRCESPYSASKIRCILFDITTIYVRFKTLLSDFNCIVTRGGVYNEILPDPEGNPEGGVQGISRLESQYSLSQLSLLANIFLY